MVVVVIIIASNIYQTVNSHLLVQNNSCRQRKMFTRAQPHHSSSSIVSRGAISLQAMSDECDAIIATSASTGGHGCSWNSSAKVSVVGPLKNFFWLRCFLRRSEPAMLLFLLLEGPWNCDWESAKFAREIKAIGRQQWIGKGTILPP